MYPPVPANRSSVSHHNFIASFTPDPPFVPPTMLFPSPTVFLQCQSPHISPTRPLIHHPLPTSPRLMITAPTDPLHRNHARPPVYRSRAASRSTVIIAHRTRRDISPSDHHFFLRSDEAHLQLMFFSFCLRCSSRMVEVGIVCGRDWRLA